jgi:hypothetical protein
MNNETPTQPAAAETIAPRATGPRTEAGKAISSQNARKHDLCSRTLRLSPEEWAEYNDMRDRYARDLQPANDVEQTLVNEICFNYWRLQQTREAELGIIEKHPTELRIIALYIRYRTGYERAFYKALDKLQHTQRLRKQETVNSQPLRSAKTLRPEEIAEAALDLEDRLETHLLENRIRAKQQLPPIQLPKALASRLDHFVSQNPGALPQQLLDSVKEAA